MDVWPVNGNSNEPDALLFGETSNSALGTFGLVKSAFCPVTNGWLGRYIALSGIETTDNVSPTT